MTLSIPLLGAMIITGVILCIVFLVGLNKKWGILLPYGGLLLFSSLSLPVDWNDRIVPTFWLPIQRVRSQLFLACGIAGLVIILFQLKRLRHKSLPLTVWVLSIAGIYAALLRFYHVGPSDGFFSIIFATATLIPLSLTALVVMDKIDDLVLPLRMIAIVNVAWIGMVFVQIAINPKYVSIGKGGRFVGVLSNPQHSGVLLAYLCVILIWLLANDPKKYKTLYLGILGIDLIFLLWTGSRTGIGMFLIGVVSILYARAGRAILILPVLAVLAYVGLKFAINVLGINIGLERLTSTTDTRSTVWGDLLTTGLENPLLGVGTTMSKHSENSWLYGFASYGIGMLTLLIIFPIAAAWESYKLFRVRFTLPSYYRPYPDLVIGIIGMYFAGAILEGYIISRVSASLCIFLLFAGSGNMIRKLANEYDDSMYEYDEHLQYEDQPYSQ